MDGKTVKILKGNFNEVKVKYTYDGIFYGKDKLKVSLGTARDTTIIVPVKNKSFQIPRFTLSNNKNNNNNMLSKAYALNREYYNSIIKNPNQYGGINSIDYKDALKFINKKQNEFKNLEQLLTAIDYTKLYIELINIKNDVNGEIIYQKKIDTKFSFGNKEVVKKENSNLPTLNINGYWSLNCKNGLTEFDVNGYNGYLSLFSDNAIYINVKIEKTPKANNEYLMYFKNTESQQKFYEDKKNIIDDEISKTKVIGKISIKNKNELIINWIGLYNLKNKNLEFVNDFVMIRENEGINPITLKKCE